MAKNKLRNIKVESSFGHKLSEKNVAPNIAVEKRQNVIKMYPKSIAGDCNKKTADDLEIYQKSDVNLQEKKDLVSNRTTFQGELNWSESPISQTGSFNSSQSSLSSFIFFELGSCFEECDRDEIKEDVNLIDWGTELNNKKSCVNSIAAVTNIFDKSVSKSYPSQKDKSPISQFTVNKKTVYDIVDEKEYTNVIKKSNYNNISKDCCKKYVHTENSTLLISEKKDQLTKIKGEFQISNEKHAELENQVSLINYNVNDINSFDTQANEQYALENNVFLVSHFANNKMINNDSIKVKSIVSKKLNSNDVTLSSIKNSVQMQDNISASSIEEDQISELKKVLERCVSCLINCLETLQKRTLKLEEKNRNLNSKSHRNASKYKCNETNRRDENITEVFSPTSYTLKNTSITNVKQAIATATYSIPIGNSKSVHMENSNRESCACGFCDDSRLDIQSIKKRLSSGNQIKITKLPKKKFNMLNVSKGEDLKNTLNASRDTLKKSHYMSEIRKSDPLFPDLLSAVRKMSDLVVNKAEPNMDSCRVVHRSKAADKGPAQNCKSQSEKSNVINKESSKSDKKSKNIKIYQNHKLGKHEYGEKATEEVISNETLFYTFLFVITCLLCLILFIYSLL